MEGIRGEFSSVPLLLQYAAAEGRVALQIHYSKAAFKTKKKLQYKRDINSYIEKKYSPIECNFRS